MKIKYEERWRSIFADFEEHYSNLASRVVEMYPVGYKEVVFMLDDGRKILFNFFNKSIRDILEDASNERDEMEWRETFMKNLNMMMYRCGYGLERLSEESGISMVTLSKYTNGKSTPSGYNLDRLAAALKCTVTDLIY